MVVGLKVVVKDRFSGEVAIVYAVDRRMMLCSQKSIERLWIGAHLSSRTEAYHAERGGRSWARILLLL